MNETDPMPRICASLALFSMTVTPEQMTEMLGASPTNSWHLGDRRSNRPNDPRVEKDHGWRLSTGYINTIEAEVAIRRLLELLEPIQSKITQLTTSPEVMAELAVYADVTDQQPSIHIASVMLQQIAKLNCDIDVDIIELSKD